MHTFFVNTSRIELKNPKDLGVLFDIPAENRKLVTMDHPLSRWEDPDCGYVRCAREIGRIIDSSTEVTSDYILIVFVDLTEFEPYAALIREPDNDRERESCLHAMRLVYTRFISATLVEKLTTSGRAPIETLVMFGEHTKCVEAETNKDQSLIKSCILRLLGIPDKAEAERLAKRIDKDPSAADKPRALFDAVIDSRSDTSAIPGLWRCFEKEIRAWAAEVYHYLDVDPAIQWLVDRLETTCETRAARDRIVSVDCRMNRTADTENLETLTLDRLNLICHLLTCVNTGTVFETVDGGRQVREFVSHGKEEYAELFCKVRKHYIGKRRELENLTGQFEKYALAPVLFQLDHELFGLDENGKKMIDVVVKDVRPDKKMEAEGSLCAAPGKEIVAVVRREDPLLSKEELPPFPDYAEDAAESLLRGGKTADDYRAAAKKTCEAHLKYLSRLRRHQSEILANYAGPTGNNTPAVLKKRKVGAGEEGCGDPSREYRYCGSIGKKTEKLKLDTVRDLSQNAQDTSEEEFIRYCAGRQVAFTDIMEQYKWFENRVSQIEEALKKLKKISLFMLLGLLILYIPFVVIQWNAITKNLATILTAVGSLAVPVVLLGIAYTLAVLRQKKKYREVWEKFKEKSDAAMENNRQVAEDYFRLFSTVIPALRWLYDYRLDVDFYTGCSETANAKLTHHKNKLRDRIVCLKNLIENLNSKTRADDTPEYGRPDELDLNAPFCSGEKNIKYYSILSGNGLAWEV